MAFFVFNLAYAEHKFGFGKQTLAYINVGMIVTETVCRLAVGKFAEGRNRYLLMTIFFFGQSVFTLLPAFATTKWLYFAAVIGVGALQGMHGAMEPVGLVDAVGAKFARSAFGKVVFFEQVFESSAIVVASRFSPVNRYYRLKYLEMKWKIIFSL